MSTEEERGVHVRVTKPIVSFLPETETSKTIAYDLQHSDLLPVYDYVSWEYLMAGVAVENSYCTRLLLRFPADPARFSGLVVAEPSHLWGGTTIWRLINRWLMRNGKLSFVIVWCVARANTRKDTLGWKLIRKLPRHLTRSKTLIPNATKTCTLSLVRP